jgi:hypothetical protein
MNGEEMNQRLQEAYADWKRSLQFAADDAAQLSPPLLLSVPPAYIEAERRILFFGQETFGWGWTRKLRKDYPKYEVDYPYTDISTLQDFLANNDSVEALCWGYRAFDFAKYQPGTRSSPFWQAFREVQGWRDVGLIWNNLSRFDYQGGSVLSAPEALRTYFSKRQCELMAKELEILQPHVCLFFTGPDYDTCLSDVFPDCTFTQVVEGIPERQLARIGHPRLPASSFRTYHPAYLSRAGHWDFIEQIRKFSEPQ